MLRSKVFRRILVFLAVGLIVALIVWLVLANPAANQETGLVEEDDTSQTDETSSLDGATVQEDDTSNISEPVISDGDLDMPNELTVTGPSAMAALPILVAAVCVYMVTLNIRVKREINSLTYLDK